MSRAHLEQRPHGVGSLPRSRRLQYKQVDPKYCSEVLNLSSGRRAIRGMLVVSGKGGRSSSTFDLLSFLPSSATLLDDHLYYRDPSTLHARDQWHPLHLEILFLSNPHRNGSSFSPLPPPWTFPSLLPPLLVPLPSLQSPRNQLPSRPSLPSNPSLLSQPNLRRKSSASAIPRHSQRPRSSAWPSSRCPPLSSTTTSQSMAGKVWGSSFARER